MMGRLNRDQGQLFYCFNLERAVPEDHQVRQIAGVLDLSWVHEELASHYSLLGRPSIDPVLMIRMLIVGYVFAIRSPLMKPNDRGDRHLKHEQATLPIKLKPSCSPLIYFGDFCNKIDRNRT
jgi:hypothetical protein